MEYRNTREYVMGIYSQLQSSGPSVHQLGPLSVCHVSVVVHGLAPNHKRRIITDYDSIIL
jgi:hypothetical protein